MFQIWRYRTSWGKISTPLHHDSRYFLTFSGRVMVSGVTKYGQDLDWSPRSHSRAPDMTLSMCMMSLLHVHDTWQHDNSEDISSILTQPADRVCSCSISRIFPHHVCGALAPRSMSVLGQHLQFTLIWRLSGQEPVSWVLHPFHYHYTCTESRPKLSFLAWAYRYPAQRGSCVKMNHWHPT